MSIPLGKLPPDRYFKAPPGGWMPHALYHVHVSVSKHNPIFPAVLFSGFLQNGKPAGYSCIWIPGSRDTLSIGQMWYMEVVRDLGLDFDPVKRCGGGL